MKDSSTQPVFEHSTPAKLTAGFPMRAHNNARRHFVRQLRGGQLSIDPSPYLYIASALPRDYFQEVLRQLPSRCHYRRARGWKHTRDACGDLLGCRGRKYELWIEHLIKGSSSECLPEDDILRTFWAQFHGWLVCDEVLSALAERFEIETTRPLRAAVRLVREEDAIYLAPHLDRPFKLLTAIFCLPHDFEKNTQGTSLYRRAEDGSMTKVQTMRFEPGSALIMARTPASWHGVEPHLHGGRRNTLHLYLREDERQADRQSQPRAATAAAPRMI